MLLRALGWLEPLELATYDRFVGAQASDAASPPPIALIRIPEEDIRRYGHPVPDALLADAIDRILGAGARAVGVDLYRDAPVPDAESYARLGEVVRSSDRTVMVMKFPGPDGVGTPPPSFLTDPSRIGFSDLPLDPGRVVRRGLLFMGDDDRTWTSFALQLAQRYLADEGIHPEADPLQPGHLKLGSATIPPFASDDGPYARADARGYQLLLDFGEPHEALPSFTLSALLSGEVGPEALRDRIVILGTTAPSVEDVHHTPAGDLYGIEVHAQAAGQLLRMARTGAGPLASLPEWAEALWILVWGLLGARLGRWSRGIPLLLGSAAAGLLALGALGVGLFGAGWFVPVVPPALAGLGSAGLVISFVAVRERRERAQVTRLFSRFLRPTVANEIWRQREQFMADHERGRPRSRMITVTTLISDLEGYTAASEAMEPEGLMGWINEYLDAMADLVDRHGGVVDDYAGDGLKANFGFPVASEAEDAIDGDAVAAVRCALAMGDAIERLNRSWESRGLRTGRVRIGILTGPVVAGVLGSARSLKYTTVGDTVNTAARLESFEKRGPDGPTSGSWRILIGEETRSRLGNRFRTRDLGKHLLPGKSHEIRVHQVLGVATAMALALLVGIGLARPAMANPEEATNPAPAQDTETKQDTSAERRPGFDPGNVDSPSARAGGATRHAEPPPGAPPRPRPSLAPRKPPEDTVGAVGTGPRSVRFVPPPGIGAPAARKGGATRGASSAPTAQSVAPEGFGLTLEEQPVLTWHLSAPTASGLTLVVYDSRRAEPILETWIDGPFDAGLQRLRLADHGVRLATGASYEWIVMLGSGTQVAQGWVRRVEPSPELRARLAHASEADRPLVLSDAGIWYDALDAFSRRVDAAPDDPRRRAERRALLTSAGLDPALAE